MDTTGGRRRDPNHSGDSHSLPPPSKRTRRLPNPISVPVSASVCEHDSGAATIAMAEAASLAASGLRQADQPGSSEHTEPPHRITTSGVVSNLPMT